MYCVPAFDPAFWNFPRFFLSFLNYNKTFDIWRCTLFSYQFCNNGELRENFSAFVYVRILQGIEALRTLFNGLFGQWRTQKSDQRCCLQSSVSSLALFVFCTFDSGLFIDWLSKVIKLGNKKLMMLHLTPFHLKKNWEKN